MIMKKPASDNERASKRVTEVEKEKDNEKASKWYNSTDGKQQIGTEATLNIDLKMEEEIHDTKVQNSDPSKIQI